MTTATQTQIRRDTATNLAAATPAQGELGYDTTNKRLVAGDGSTAGGIPHVNFADQQKQKFVYATVGGTANAITLTNSPAVASYAAPLTQIFKASATNTTSVTANVDGLGAKNVKKMLDGSLQNLSAGDIVSGGIYELVYDGTQFQIKGLGVTTPTPSGLVYLGSATASNSIVVDLTSLMSSTYDDYIIKFKNLTPATGGASIFMRVSTNNGSSYDSGSNYAYAYSDTSSGVGGNTGTTLLLIAQGSNTYKKTGCVELFDVNTSSPQRVHWNSSFANAATIIQGMVGWGTWNSASAINAIRFFASSGNIASGTFRVYGISKT